MKKYIYLITNLKSKTHYNLKKRFSKINELFSFWKNYGNRNDIKVGDGKLFLIL